MKLSKASKKVVAYMKEIFAKNIKNLEKGFTPETNNVMEQLFSLINDVMNQARSFKINEGLANFCYNLLLKSLFLVPVYLHSERRRVIDQSRVISLPIEKLHPPVPLASGRHLETKAPFLIERLKLHEQPWVVEEVFEIIGAAELEEVDLGALFCYIEEGHYTPRRLWLLT